MSAHETEAIRALRRENLAGLSGRVLEVGAGTGTNFEFYPDAVTEVVAVEPERRLAELAQQAAATAPFRSPSVPTQSSSTWRPEASRSTPSYAPWCCAPSKSLTAFYGNCFRHCGRVASCATSNTSPAPGHGATAEVRRRHLLAAVVRQLPHPSRYRRERRARRLPGIQRPARMDHADVGAVTGCRVRDRPRGQACLTRGAARAASGNSPGNAPAAVSRNDTVAASDSGVRSGLTSMTTVPLASAISGRPAAG